MNSEYALIAPFAKPTTTAPPPIATHYYTQGDLFLFDEFQTGNPYAGAATPRRPSIDTLYDVFVNVRNDEAEHMKVRSIHWSPYDPVRVVNADP